MNFLETNQQPEIVKRSHYVKKAVISVVVLLLLGASGAAYYFYNQWNVLKNNPNKVAADETKAVVAEVGKLILLPTGEDPTVATVTDPSKLKDQPFFVNAKVGDKVLVYAKAKQAYLYDPTQDKIINVAPINTDAQSSANQTSGATAQTSGTSTTNANNSGLELKK